MSVTKSATLDKSFVITILKNLFVQLDEWHNKRQPVEMSDLDQYFTRHFELTSNGKILNNDLNEYVARIEKLKKRYSKISFKLTHDEPLFEENRYAVHYTIQLTPRTGGQPISVEVIALATLEGEKINMWHQVAHEKGSGHWDI